MRNLKGKLIVITGAALGMGKGMALRFAADGANLALLDINKEALDKTVEEVRAKGVKVEGFICDITDRKQVAETKDKVHASLGKCDVLLNNAGIVFGGNFLEVSEETMQRTMDVNIMSYMWMTRAFLPDMIEKKAGHIVNMASAAGLMGVPKLTAYCSSKFACVGFSESLRAELVTDGYSDIPVTIVCPSYVATGMFAGVKAPFGSPMLTTEKMVRLIYDAVIFNKPYVLAPAVVKISPFLKAIIPVGVFNKLNKTLGVTSSMNHWTGRK